MSNGLPPANWIQPPDVAGSFLHGAQLGIEKARLAQQGQQAQQEFAQQQLSMQARHDQQDREAEMEKQRLAITQSYHQQQMQLGQQKLQEAQQMNQAKIQAAATQSAAKMRIDSRVAAGEDFNKVMMEEGASAGFGGSAMAAIGKAQQNQAYLPEEMTSESGQRWGRGAPASPWAPLKEQPAPKTVEVDREIAWRKKEAEKAQVILDNPKASEDMKQEAQSTFNRNARIANQLRWGKTPGATNPSATASPAAGAPKIAGRYVDGKLVMTSDAAAAPSTAAPAASQPQAAPASPASAAYPDLYPAPHPAAVPAPAAQAVPQKVAPPGAELAASIGTFLGKASVPSSKPINPESSEDKILSAWRTGGISKSEAQKEIGRHIIGPEWISGKRPKEFAQEGPAVASEEDKALSSWRSGEISKTEAMKSLGRHIIGPEWNSSKSQKATWHLAMKKDEDGNQSHWYED